MVRSLTSLGFRLAGVAGKFVAIVVLAAGSSATEVGKFTLFFSAINILVFVISFDFYQFVFREVIARRTPAGRLRVLFGQQIFNGMIYGIVLATALAISASGWPAIFDLPVFWLAAVLITDHAAQELSRIFTVLARPTHANIIYAIKTGAWAWAGAAVGVFSDSPLRADTFYPLWLGANLIGILIGLGVMVFEFRAITPSLPPRYRDWLTRGVWMSSPFYATSLATICLGLIDRFIIAGSQTVAAAGIYSFWQSAASLIPIILYAVCGMHFLPRLMTAVQRGQHAEFRELRQKFLTRSLVVSAILASVLLLCAPLIPALIVRSEMGAPRLLVVLLVTAAVMTALWQVPYQALYSRRDDTFLAVSIVSVTSLSVVFNLLLVPLGGAMSAAGVAAAASTGLFLILSGREHRISRHWPERDAPQRSV
jgi:O-antigen/teichoic acid export membrane protein